MTAIERAEADEREQPIPEAQSETHIESLRVKAGERNEAERSGSATATNRTSDEARRHLEHADRIQRVNSAERKTVSHARVLRTRRRSRFRECESRRVLARNLLLSRKYILVCGSLIISKCSWCNHTSLTSSAARTRAALQFTNRKHSSASAARIKKFRRPRNHFATRRSCVNFTPRRTDYGRTRPLAQAALA